MWQLLKTASLSPATGAAPSQQAGVCCPSTGETTGAGEAVRDSQPS